MNNTKIFSIGYALAMSMVPISTYAASAQAGLEACMDALVNELARDSSVPTNYNLDPDSWDAKSRLSRREVFHLDARDSKSRAIVARADCIVDQKARVRKLTSVPLNAGDARDRASKFY